MARKDWETYLGGAYSVWVDLSTPDRPTLALARLEYMLFLPPVAGASLGPPCPCENSWLSWLEGPDCWSAAGA
jgi:hypothetical protein